jgi:hypothetical protein
MQAYQNPQISFWGGGGGGGGGFFPAGMRI